MEKELVGMKLIKSPFETAFVKEVMSKVDVQDFDDVCKVIGLKMGTDVWINKQCQCVVGKRSVFI